MGGELHGVTLRPNLPTALRFSYTRTLVLDARATTLELDEHGTDVEVERELELVLDG
jgi:hypothetical protein